MDIHIDTGSGTISTGGHILAFVIEPDKVVEGCSTPEELLQSTKVQHQEWTKFYDAETDPTLKELWDLKVKTSEVMLRLVETMHGKSMTVYQMISTWAKVKGFVLSELLNEKLGIN